MAGVSRRPDRQPWGWAIGVVVVLVLVAGIALVATRMGTVPPPPTTVATVPGDEPPVAADPAGTQSTTPTTRSGPPAPTRGAQAPGVYATSTFAPALQYRLADGGWSIPEGDSNPDWIEMVRGDSQHVLNFIRVQRVYRRTGPILTAAEALGAVEAVPENLNNWLLTHPQRKETSPSQPVPALPKGATAGAQIDFTVSPGYPYENCPTPCALLFQLDGNRPAAKQKDERTRYYVFRVGSDRMVATVSAPAADFDAFARLAEQVIASAELRPR